MLTYSTAAATLAATTGTEGSSQRLQAKTPLAQHLHLCLGAAIHQEGAMLRSVGLRCWRTQACSGSAPATSATCTTLAAAPPYPAPMHCCAAPTPCRG